MPNSEMLNASCASASDRSSAALTAGITGRNKWTVSGPIRAIDARDNRNNRLGTGAIAFFSLGYWTAVNQHIQVDQRSIRSKLGEFVSDCCMPVGSVHSQRMNDPQ